MQINNGLVKGILRVLNKIIAKDIDVEEINEVNRFEINTLKNSRSNIQKQLDQIGYIEYFNGEINIKNMSEGTLPPVLTDEQIKINLAVGTNSNYTIETYNGSQFNYKNIFDYDTTSYLTKSDNSDFVDNVSDYPMRFSFDLGDYVLASLSELYVSPVTAYKSSKYLDGIAIYGSNSESDYNNETDDWEILTTPINDNSTNDSYIVQSNNTEKKYRYFMITSTIKNWKGYISELKIYGNLYSSSNAVLEKCVDDISNKILVSYESEKDIAFEHLSDNSLLLILRDDQDINGVVYTNMYEDDNVLKTDEV